jgi:methylase of polypeptide subunit release factors
MNQGDLPPIEIAARPLVLWRLRRSREPGEVALRVLTACDPVPEAEVRAALRGVDVDAAMGAGLLERTAAGAIVSPFNLSPFDGRYFLGDRLERGGDAVMAWGAMTVELMRATWPRPRMTAALDVGCGAGTCALLLAESADRVVGCDINARAIALGGVNAAFTDVTNVEFRQGDLCAPVEDERFDLIVCQPPFVPRPPDGPDATYLWGGPRGDELPLRAIREVSRRLRDGGRALFFVQWALFDDEPVETRVRRAVDDDRVDVLVLEAPGQDKDANAIGEAATEHGDLGEDYVRTALALREHFERIGVNDFHHTIVVLRRRTEGHAWTGTTRVPRFSEERLTGTHVDALLRAHELAARGTAPLLEARLRLPKGTAFVREEDGLVRAVFPSGHLLREIALRGAAHAMVAAIHEATTVREAARKLAKQHGAPVDAVIENLVPAAADFLRAGVLQ